MTADDGVNKIKLSSIGAPDCVFGGPSEKLGTFKVTVVKPGYYPGGTTIVVDQRDECHHVITKDATVALIPQ